MYSDSRGLTVYVYVVYDYGDAGEDLCHYSESA